MVKLLQIACFFQQNLQFLRLRKLMYAHFSKANVNFFASFLVFVLVKYYHYPNIYS